MAGTHALLSPSKAEQWMNCAGSIHLTRDLPNETSEYAAEGTAYHDLAAKCLISGMECADFIGQVFEADGYKFTIDAENAEYCQQYVDAIRRMDGKLFVEVKVLLSDVWGIPDQGGTSDAIVVNVERKLLRVHDLKFGRGEVVYAKRNKQALTYASGAVETIGRQYGVGPGWTIEIGIHQPRINHFDTDTLTFDELVEFEREQFEAAKLAYAIWCYGDTERALQNLKPTAKGCRWCLFAGKCKARSEKMLTMFPVMQSEQIAEKRGQLSDVELEDLYMKVDDLEKWIAAIRLEALTRANNGVKFAQHHLVEGRKGARKFGDDMIAEAVLFGALGDEAYKPRALITPTEAEKRMKKSHADEWGQLAPYITQSPGTPTLERIEDKRPPVKIDTPEFPAAPPAAAGLL